MLPNAIAAHRASARVGVLLINLGTPSAPTPSAIRRYLRQFLWDQRVVELPRLPWWLILNLFILPLRPRRLAHAYASIWESGGSPLLLRSQALAAGLAQSLSEELDCEIPVALGMRYGEPSVETALQNLYAAQVRRLLVLPLFPQYSASTTGSAYDAVGQNLARTRWVPELRTLNAYHDAPAYITALADSVRKHWQQHGRGEHLLLSFHGIPQRYVRKGDPYFCHCQKTARLLAAALALDETQWSLAFQSRFGRDPWVQPYTDATLEALSARGIKTLDVICPGFAADCLETLEEVAVGYRQYFANRGGTLRYITALNDQPEHIRALTALLRPHLQSWLPDVESAAAVLAREQRAESLSLQFNDAR